MVHSLKLELLIYCCITVCSWDSYVWEQHCYLQVRPGPALLCDWRWWWKRTHLSYSSSGILWCSCPSLEVLFVIIHLCFFILVKRFISLFFCFMRSSISLAVGTLLIKGRHSKTWISFFYALMRLLMEGM